MTNIKNKKKKRKNESLYYLDNVGKRLLVPIENKYAVRNVDQLNKASDYKKNKFLRGKMKDEYVRRLILQTRKSRKLKKLFQKRHKTRKNPVVYIKKLSIKEIEDTYYYLLNSHKPKGTRKRRRRRKKRRRKKSTKK